MSNEQFPDWFLHLRQKHGKLIEAVQELGKVIRKEGPLDEKTSQLIQLAAAATIRSEGAVHSHTKRALSAGAEPDEIYHAIMLLTSTIGFPNVSAALSWVGDVLEKKEEK